MLLNLIQLATESVFRESSEILELALMLISSRLYEGLGNKLVLTWSLSVSLSSWGSWDSGRRMNGRCSLPLQIEYRFVCSHIASCKWKRYSETLLIWTPIFKKVRKFTQNLHFPTKIDFQ